MVDKPMLRAVTENDDKHRLILSIARKVAPEALPGMGLWRQGSSGRLIRWLV